MNKPKVTIGVILFTGCEKYLSRSLPSLLNQDYESVEFLIREQSPNQEVLMYLKDKMPELLSRINVEVGKNLMHSGGHNAMIRKSTGDYYIAASNDMLYPFNMISSAINELEKPENHSFGTATPKMMQWDFANLQKTNIIDSCGIAVTKSHHFYDMGQGDEDKGQYDDVKEVFGASGALTIFRRSALDAIEVDGEYFDELMHYKGDIDMAYRLQWAGQKCMLLPHVKVYHDRQVAGNQNVLKARKSISRWAKHDSMYGHLITLNKNFDSGFSIKTKLKTKLYNLIKLGYITVREPYLLKEYARVKKIQPALKIKRKSIKKSVKPSAIEHLMR